MMSLGLGIWVQIPGLNAWSPLLQLKYEKWIIPHHMCIELNFKNCFTFTLTPLTEIYMPCIKVLKWKWTSISLLTRNEQFYNCQIWDNIIAQRKLPYQALVNPSVSTLPTPRLGHLILWGICNLVGLAVGSVRKPLPRGGAFVNSSTRSD